MREAYMAGSDANPALLPVTRYTITGKNAEMQAAF